MEATLNSPKNFIARCLGAQNSQKNDREGIARYVNPLHPPRGKKETKVSVREKD